MKTTLKLLTFALLILTACEKAKKHGATATTPTLIAPSVETKLFAYSGSQYTGQITGFEVNKITGVLTPLATAPSAQALPMISAVSNDKKFLVAANYSSHSVSVFKINPATGELTHVANTPLGANNPSWIAAHPSLRRFYSANAGSNNITVLDLDENGAVAIHANVAAGSGVTALAIDSQATHLYSADQNADQIGIYTLDAQGNLSNAIGSVALDSGAQPNHLAISTGDRALYAGNWGTGTINGYKISGNTLTSTGPAVSTGAGGVYTVAISNDGAFIYANKPYNNQFTAHAIDQTTLQPGTLSVVPLNGAVSLSFWKDFAFAVSWTNAAGGLPIETRAYNLGIAPSATTATGTSYRGLYQLLLVEIPQ